MNERRAIHQVVHTLSYGDAISTEVVSLQQVLRSLGYESEIYAIHEHPKLRGRTRHYTSLPECSQADIILHYSLGSPLNPLYRSWTKGRRILVYHNITPAEWFRGVNQRVADDITQGITELPVLCAESDAIWADSAFNASEIAALGYQSEVLELLVAPERWTTARNEGIFSLVSGQPGIHLLHVGRLAPNKKVEDIIKSFYYLQKQIEPNSYLWLVGIDTDTELYSFSLKQLAWQLGIEQSVRFAGCLADEEVRALYEACTVYLCMSEHEGFCLPVIEAMHFGLPVIAYDSGAVPQTLGSGGVLVREKRYLELAQLIARIARDETLRGKIVASGRSRVGHFGYERFAGRVRELLEGLQHRGGSLGRNTSKHVDSSAESVCVVP